MASKHDGEKISCDKCDYKATRTLLLKLHTQFTHDVIGYACGECGYKATGKHFLKFHMAA